MGDCYEGDPDCYCRLDADPTRWPKRRAEYLLAVPVVPPEPVDVNEDEADEVGPEKTRDELAFEARVVETYTDALKILLKKHQDYGPKNISDSPGGPLNGLRVRMHDKLARINNLIDSGVEPENESLRDSFLDLMNYSAIAMLVLDGNWPTSGQG